MLSSSSHVDTRSRQASRPTLTTNVIRTSVSTDAPSEPGVGSLPAVCAPGRPPTDSGSSSLGMRSCSTTTQPVAGLGQGGEEGRQVDVALGRGGTRRAPTPRSCRRAPRRPRPARPGARPWRARGPIRDPHSRSARRAGRRPQQQVAGVEQHAHVGELHQALISHGPDVGGSVVVEGGLEAAVAAALLRPLHALGQAPPPPSSSPISRMSFRAAGAHPPGESASTGRRRGRRRRRRARACGRARGSPPPPLVGLGEVDGTKPPAMPRPWSARGARAARAPRRGSPAAELRARSSASAISASSSGPGDIGQ